MTPFYHQEHRRLQDRFDSRRIADRLAGFARDAFTDDDRAFIESLPCCFLATADAEGRPDCSFKGGMPGFVKLTGPSELAFPDYDGNGMFRSLGNIMANPGVGLLFIALHGGGAAAQGQRRGIGQPRRSAAGGNRRRSDDRAGQGAGDLSELPALCADDADGRSLGLRAPAGLRPA